MTLRGSQFDWFFAFMTSHGCVSYVVVSQHFWWHNIHFVASFHDEIIILVLVFEASFHNEILNLVKVLIGFNRTAWIWTNLMWILGQMDQIGTAS